MPLIATANADRLRELEIRVAVLTQRNADLLAERTALQARVKELEDKRETMALEVMDRLARLAGVEPLKPATPVEEVPEPDLIGEALKGPQGRKHGPRSAAQRHADTVADDLRAHGIDFDAYEHAKVHGTPFLARPNGRPKGPAPQPGMGDE